ncbi:MAG: serine protease [Deltaproteobacteria bacterium]|nr:MAG: serine protease [Deltaproteobacteria bacterium]
MKAITLAILILSLSLSPLCLLAEQKGSWKRYPLPAVEAEEVLFRWLEQSGFIVSRSLSESTAVQLTGAKGNERWRILIRPYSPLASSIEVQYTSKDQPDQNKQEILWAFLEDYSKGFNGEEKNLNQEVPAGVLSKRESVVCIKGKEKNEPIQFSGFIVNGKGFILSTAHDLKGIEEIIITLSDGQGQKGSLVKIDAARDLALIRVSSTLRSFISLEKGRELLIGGEKIYSIGCHNHEPGVIHRGYVRGPLKQADGLPLWQVDMGILPGNSGSPVFDAEGNLVGVVKGRYRGTETVGFLIPIETVMNFLKER